MSVKNALLIIPVLLLIALSHAAAYDMKDFERYFKLLPRPQRIELKGASQISFNSIKSVFLNGETVKPVMYGVLKSLPLTDKAAKGVVVLSVSKNITSPGNDEGYRITIDENQVRIEARGNAGLFYGCQTFEQLLEDARDQQVNIPGCTITDYPDVTYRAVHLDLKHHLDAGHYYYDLIDRLAAIKINAIIVEFEDKLRFKKATVVAASNAVTVDEFAAISRYARERHIEVSPLVQGLGHASYILKHEVYKNLRDTISSDWSFDPLNPETYALQFSLYEDAIAATPYGRYLHVGGDEVGNLGMSELSKKSGLTPMQLQMEWLKKVTAFAGKHNRIPIFWDDMVFKLSGLYRTTWDKKITTEEVNKAWQENSRRLEESIALFPKECVYMRWNYDSPDIPGNHKALDWYKSHDLKVMAATAAQTVWPMLPRNNSNFTPIKEFCRITSEKKLDGILCTAWDDCSPHAETYWRGFYNFAFFSWHYSDAGIDDVHTRFRHRFYAPAIGGVSYNFQDLLEQALEFWDTALIEKGRRNNYPGSVNLLELPDHQKSGAWKAKYDAKITQAKKELVRYQVILDQITKALRVANRNAYSLEMLHAVNELQIYPARLIVLMENYDMESTKATKESAHQKLIAFIKSFPEVRTQYETVFSKTRFLYNDSNYLQDQNHHRHLANGTTNGDWMYVYELAMNKKILLWSEKQDRP